MCRALRLANTFDEIARPFLSDMGFELVNDPGQFVGRYLATRAVYKSRNGFFLSVGFEPLDGSFAVIVCGRSWNYTSEFPEPHRFERFSNAYFTLAKRFGFELPRSYKLRVEDEANSDLLRILRDLETTLPTILECVTLGDLIAVERENGGCQWHEKQGWHKSTSIKFEGISPFVQRTKSR
jgi:hypothetical protein